MAEILDIADRTERKRLLQRLANQRWRTNNPDLNQEAIERAKQKAKEDRRELKRLREENAVLKAEVEFLSWLWDLFREPQNHNENSVNSGSCVVQ